MVFGQIRQGLVLMLTVLIIILLLFTEIGRDILYFLLGVAILLLIIAFWLLILAAIGAILWLLINDNMPLVVSNVFGVVFFSVCVWVVVHAIYKRIKTTKMKYKSLKGWSLLKKSWSEREQVLRSDKYIEQSRREAEGIKNSSDE